MSKMKSTVQFMLVWSLKLAIYLSLSSYGVFWLMEHFDKNLIGADYIFIPALILVVMPGLMPANYGTFIKILSGKVSTQLPLEDYSSIAIKSAIITCLVMAVLVAFIIGLIDFGNDRIIAGSVLMLVSCLLVIALIKVAKALLQQVTNPEIVPIEISRDTARRLFWASNLVTFSGFAFVGLAWLGCYLSGWGHLYMWGGISLVGSVLAITYFFYKARRIMKDFNFPEKVELVGGMRYLNWTIMP